MQCQKFYYVSRNYMKSMFGVQIPNIGMDLN